MGREEKHYLQTLLFITYEEQTHHCIIAIFNEDEHSGDGI